MGFADPVDYIVVSFEGDYAMLRKADEPDAQLIQVAIALLPDGATDGSRVRRVMLDYTLLEQNCGRIYKNDGLIAYSCLIFHSLFSFCIKSCTV